ncbi:Hpt domain-containing protein [uncultured Draconibacterium sp.]|uniref:Hpt domain-containing protein n=1 Tax=uncultured Draconibacterium sp. TaxID=1573823 RepID=UPI0025DA9D4E|nr:Hpt domain-containing protein [uncultured Draconibacterium sp.]
MSTTFQHINTAQIDTLSAGDMVFKKELAQIFLEQIDEFTTNMGSFLASEQWDKLAREAHTAKSSAMTFGMEKTGTLLKKIQLECEAGNLYEVPQMVKDASNQLQAAVPELNQILNG